MNEEAKIDAPPRTYQSAQTIGPGSHENHSNLPSFRRKPVPTPYEKPQPIRFRFADLFSRYDSNRTYFGLRRRNLLIVLGVAIILVLGLIIGLAAGLTAHKKSQNLPLPSSSEHFTGDLTYYAPALGACGITSTDSQAICAVSHILFDAVQKGSNPNANPLCGLKIRAQRYKEGVGERSEDLTVVDRCVGCAVDDIDVSPGAFEKLADPTLGRVGVTWAWLNPAPTGK